MPNLATNCEMQMYHFLHHFLCYSSLLFFFPFPSLVPSALWTLCIYANVKGKILSLHFKFSDYI